MGYLIPLVVILAGIAGISYVLIRKIRTMPSVVQENGLVYPDFDNREPKNDTEKPRSYLGRMFGMEEGGNLFIFMEKFFRKMRVRMMKIENWLAGVSLRLLEKGLQKKTSRETDRNSVSKSGSTSQNGATFISMQDKNGEFDERYWFDIIKEEPQSAYPYKKLGDIYLAREDFREARWALKRALALDSSDAEAKSKIEGLRGRRTRRNTKSD